MAEGEGSPKTVGRGFELFMSSPRCISPIQCRVWATFRVISPPDLEMGSQQLRHPRY